MTTRASEELRTFRHLTGLLAEDFPTEVSGRRLRLEIASNALDTEAGQVLALTVARLAPRFCHHIDFVCPDAPCAKRLGVLLNAEAFSGQSLVTLAETIWPDGEYTDVGGMQPASVERSEVVLVMGGRRRPRCRHRR